jgi:hypothetical protein
MAWRSISDPKIFTLVPIIANRWRACSFPCQFFFPPPNSANAAHLHDSEPPIFFPPILILGYNFALNAQTPHKHGLYSDLCLIIQNTKHGGHWLYGNAIEGERKHRKSEHKILENNYRRDCRKEIKTGTGKEKRKEINEIKGDTQIAGDGDILSKRQDINKRMRGKKEQCIQNVNVHYGTEKATDEEANVKVGRVYCMEKKRSWVERCQEQTITERCK